jgi:hypothetical protein
MEDSAAIAEKSQSSEEKCPFAARFCDGGST